MVRENPVIYRANWAGRPVYLPFKPSLGGPLILCVTKFVTEENNFDTRSIKGALYYAIRGKSVPAHFVYCIHTHMNR